MTLCDYCIPLVRFAHSWYDSLWLLQPLVRFAHSWYDSLWATANHSCASRTRGMTLCETTANHSCASRTRGMTLCGLLPTTRALRALVVCLCVVYCNHSCASRTRGMTLCGLLPTTRALRALVVWLCVDYCQPLVRFAHSWYDSVWANANHSCASRTRGMALCRLLPTTRALRALVVCLCVL